MANFLNSRIEEELYLVHEGASAEWAFYGLRNKKSILPA